MCGIRQSKWFVVSLAIACLTARNSPAAGKQSLDNSDVSPWEVGTRITDVILTKDHRGQPFNGSFVGSITKLKAEQDYWPDKLYVQYRFLPSLAVGVSYDRFGAAAWDDYGTDGTTWMQGPLAYVSGRYLNDSRFTPYGELGAAYFFAEFDHSSGWGNVPGKAFNLDNTHGVYVAVGCEAQIDDYWSADLYGRYMHVNVHGVYTDPGQSDEDILFTMSNITLGLGVKYTF